MAGLLLASLLLLAARLWIAPRIVEAVLLSQLHKLGFDEVHFESVHFGFDHLEVGNLLLGSGEPGAGTVRIPAVRAEFSLVDLWHRRIDTLLLDEPAWTMAPGRPASPFDDVLRGFEGRAATMPTHILPAMPVRHVAIRGGWIATQPGRSPTSATVDATLTAAGGRWDIDVQASAGAHGVRVSATLREGQQHATGTVAVWVRGARPIELEGTCRLQLEAGERVLSLELDRVPGPFEVAFTGATWSGDGVLELEANVPFAHPDAASLAMHVEDFLLVSTAGVRLSGLAGDMNLMGLPMPASSGPQHVRWRHLEFAGVKAGSGDAEFELQSGLELRARVRQRAVDEIGSVEISDLRLAPGLHDFPATVVFDRVPLQAWLELLSRGRVTGDGRLSGSLALVVQTEPHLSLDLLGGQLAAAPGGVVRFLDDAESEGLIRQRVEQIAASTGHDALVRERLVAALKEFAYTVLDFRFDRAAAGDGVTLRVHAVGEGRQVPQQLDVTVNLEGFDAAVDTAIAIKFGLDRSKRSFEDKLDNQPKTIPMQRKPL